METVLAWISTERDLPNMALGQIPHFQVPSLQNYYAKWCSNRIALRLLVHRLHDSGQFWGLRGEEMLGAGLYQCTNLANRYRKILESRESLSSPDVRGILLPCKSRLAHDASFLPATRKSSHAFYPFIEGSVDPGDVTRGTLS